MFLVELVVVRSPRRCTQLLENADLQLSDHPVDGAGVVLCVRSRSAGADFARSSAGPISMPAHLPAFAPCGHRFYLEQSLHVVCLLPTHDGEMFSLSIASSQIDFLHHVGETPSVSVSCTCARPLTVTP